MPVNLKRFFKPGDTQFMFRAIIISLLVMAILHAYTPYITDTKAAVSREQVEAYAAQAKFIEPEAVSGFLKQSEKPSMVFIYASWCTYCRSMMPIIHELWQRGDIDGSRLLLLSLDTSATDLSNYLLENRYAEMAGVPLMVRARQKDALKATLAGFGSGFTGGIPYTGIFAPGGMLRREVQGAVSKDSVIDQLQYLK